MRVCAHTVLIYSIKSVIKQLNLIVLQTFKLFLKEIKNKTKKIYNKHKIETLYMVNKNNHQKHIKSNRLSTATITWYQ